ncbi:DUF1491 family protein [Sphingomonas montanisoli]|uniref:DUF1491 family protein n=1 Tax=Sphingomonas montanisoli TaxID=2606412 RepID=A0A5D9C3F8_9SPHN|nr:DUF1491 family protein [Sphingomonas montanisoli]TZG26388.1 DUF1491 family protein [Sphingomonas montanisoli]
MIEPRAASALLVSALIRRIQDDGGSAMVLARGDEIAGSIIVALADRGVPLGLVERVWRFEGGFGLDSVGPTDPIDQTDYIARRRRTDPDLWVIEADHRDARAIAEALLA